MAPLFHTAPLPARLTGLPQLRVSPPSSVPAAQVQTSLQRETEPAATAATQHRRPRGSGVHQAFSRHPRPRLRCSIGGRGGAGGPPPPPSPLSRSAPSASSPKPCQSGGSALWGSPPPWRACPRAEAPWMTRAPRAGRAWGSFRSGVPPTSGARRRAEAETLPPLRPRTCGQSKAQGTRRARAAGRRPRRPHGPPSWQSPPPSLPPNVIFLGARKRRAAEHWAVRSGTLLRCLRVWLPQPVGGLWQCLRVLALTLASLARRMGRPLRFWTATFRPSRAAP